MGIIDLRLFKIANYDYPKKLQPLRIALVVIVDLYCVLWEVSPIPWLCG